MSARGRLVSLCFCLGLILGAPGTGAAQKAPGDLAKFFSSQETDQAVSSLDFKVSGGYAEIQTGSPDSSGRYFLAGQFIERVGTNIFRLDLDFRKKLEQDVISFDPPFVFNERRSYYFWYNNGDKVVFKVGAGKQVVTIEKKEIMRVKIQSLETYTIEREKLFKDFQIKDGSTVVFLQIKFI